MHPKTVAGQRAMSHHQLLWSWRSTCPTTVQRVPHRVKVTPSLTFVLDDHIAPHRRLLRGQGDHKLVDRCDQFRRFDPAIAICDHKGD